MQQPDMVVADLSLTVHGWMHENYIYATKWQVYMQSYNNLEDGGHSLSSLLGHNFSICKLIGIELFDWFTSLCYGH